MSDSENLMSSVSTNALNSAIKIFNILAFQGSIIVPSAIVTATLFTSNLAKGVIYLFFLIVAVLMRYVFRTIAGISSDTKCAKLSTFETDSTDSIFVLSYTVAYVCGPTIKTPNLYVLFMMLFYLSITVGAAFYNSCVTIKMLIFELITGIGLAILFMICIIVPLSGMTFILGNSPSNAEKCNLPSSEKFKCTVANNGALGS
jgi:hypothetical protein